MISTDHVIIVTCNVLRRYLISPPLIFHPNPPKLKNGTNFSFFDVHVWRSLYSFGSTSRELLVIFTSLSCILAFRNPKMSPTFDFFDARIWSYLHVFGPPLSYPLDMTQLRAPYPSCILTYIAICPSQLLFRQMRCPKAIPSVNTSCRNVLSVEA